MISALQELVLPLIVFALMTGVLNLRHTTTGYNCLNLLCDTALTLPLITLLHL